MLPNYVESSEVFDHFNTGNYEYVDSMLLYLAEHIELYSTLLILGILRSTHSGKMYLNNRTLYVEKAKEEFKRRGENEASILKVCE